MSAELICVLFSLRICVIFRRKTSKLKSSVVVVGGSSPSILDKRRHMPPWAPARNIIFVYITIYSKILCLFYFMFWPCSNAEDWAEPDVVVAELINVVFNFLNAILGNENGRNLLIFLFFPIVNCFGNSRITRSFALSED